MKKSRLEAFSDGVLAIIITIMVLELKVPHGSDIAALKALGPVFLSYILSFIYVGIYWNNHHHLLHATEHVSGKVLWANLHLLFWLSLIPFVTGWMGENHFAEWPVALYGFVLLMCALAYYLLTRALVHLHSHDSALATALSNDMKGKISTVLYFIAVPLTFVNEWLSLAVYILVAVMWFLPDRRIEKLIVE